MTRILLSLGSALILTTAYFFLAGGSNANAAEDAILAPGNPPLTRDVSDSSAQVTVFMLKVVASGTANADDFELDGDLLDEWAALWPPQHGALSVRRAAATGDHAALRGALQEAWPQASASERARAP